MKFIIKFKKLISIITASCLLVTFVIQPAVVNAMTNEEVTKKYKQIFKDFVLPYSYGQITKAHYAGTDRVIINIQDLHCHPKVQRNISNIIETFDKSYGVNKVYLEGAYGQVDTSWIANRVKKDDLANLLDKMIETGRLTGAEYYSVLSGRNEIITGLEKKEPYLENLKRFGEIVENQEKINLILKATDESLAELKKQYYTKRQYKIEELSKDYKEGKISSQKYYTLLSKHIEKLGIDLTKYENTFTYIMLLELQKQLDYSKITTELQNLVIFFRNELPQGAYQILLDNTENLSRIDKLYAYVVQISRLLELPLSVNFPNLDKYFGYIEFSQKINPLELISEEEQLSQEINTRFSETKAQREVVFLTNFRKYLGDYVTSKITSSDYEYYKENIDTYRNLWNKYVDNRVLSLLDEYITEADKFYKINTDRNIYFTDNMFKESDVLNKIENEKEAKGDINKIIENMKGVKEIDIVITGGFHSQTVTEILQNHGVSYIVITPNVEDGVKLAEDTYYEIAKEQSKISFQALATLPFSAYPEKLRIKAAINAFGINIAKEIFPDKISQIEHLDFSSEEIATTQQLAQQMANLKRIIEENKFLESDDQDFVDFLKEISGENVGLELSKYVDLEELEESLIEGQVNSIKEILKNAEKDMTSDKTSRAIRQTIRKIRRKFKKATEKFRSREEYAKKQDLINKINSVNLSFLDSDLLKDIREENKEKIAEINKRFKDRKLESLSLKELEEYWILKKEILTIFEPKDEEGVKSVLEDVFSDIEVFISFIGNSAPNGDYAKIALSFSAAFAEQLSQKLGRSRFGIISSTTTDEGSIDAISTIVAQMYDALMVYVTAIDYLKYVNPEKYPGSKYYKEIQRLVGNIDKNDLLTNGTNLNSFLTAFKFVTENGNIYSQSVAKANNKDSSNVAVIIGGGNIAIKDDLKNAIEAGNEIFLINSKTLSKQSQAPALDHENLTDLNSQYVVGNAVQYILNIIDLINKKAISIDENGDVSVNLPEFEFTREEKEKISQLENKKKRLAELRNKNDKNKTKEMKALEEEIDALENSLDQLKIFYYLLKEKVLTNKEKYNDLITLTRYLLEKFGELGKDIITLEDLSDSKLKIHVFNMEDDIDKKRTVEKEDVYRIAAKKVAEEVVKYLQSHSFFKKAITYSDLKDEDAYGQVTNEKIERQAFDLEYAKGHGYVEVAGIEEIKTAGGKTSRTVYKLKDADSSGHYSKFIVGDNITDEFRTDFEDYAIDPMFVIYEDGTVGFMTQQDFKNVYGEKKKDKFTVTKEETEVSVYFLEPRTIIETKEGRVTVHPDEVVIKRGNSIYAMSIEQFKRLYPNNEQNRPFYEKYGDKLGAESTQDSISDKKAGTTESRVDKKEVQEQTAKKSSLEQPKEQKQPEISAKQQIKNKKKFDIKKVVSVLIVSIIMTFSLIVGTPIETKAKAIDNTAVTYMTEEHSNQEEDISPKTISDAEINELWKSFGGNSSSDNVSEDFNDSIIFSNGDEFLKAESKLKSLLNSKLDFSLNENTKILMVKGTEYNNYALADTNRNMIVIYTDTLSIDNINSLISLLSGNIPKEFYSKDYGKEISPMDKALSLLEQIVHEGTHINNAGKNLFPLEDERQAVFNEIMVVDKLIKAGILNREILEKYGVVISKPDMRLSTGEYVNHVQLMKLVGFSQMIYYKKQIEKEFEEQTGFCSGNIGYSYIIYGYNSLGITPSNSNYNSQQIIIIAEDRQTGEKISVIIDTGINIDTGYEGTYDINAPRQIYFAEDINKNPNAKNIKKVKKIESESPTEATVNKRESEYLDEKLEEKAIDEDKELTTEQEKSSSNKKPILAFFSIPFLAIAGFITKKILNNKKSANIIKFLKKAIKGSLLVGFSQAVPMIVKKSETFVKEYHSNYRLGDTRVPIVKTFKAIFFVSVGIAVISSIANPLTLPIGIIFSALSIILPHQMYDISKDIKSAQALKKDDLTTLEKLQDEKLGIVESLKDSKKLRSEQLMSDLTPIIDSIISNSEGEFATKLKDKFDYIEINEKEIVILPKKKSNVDILRIKKVGEKYVLVGKRYDYILDYWLDFIYDDVLTIMESSFKDKDGTYKFARAKRFLKELKKVLEENIKTNEANVDVDVNTMFFNRKDFVLYLLNLINRLKAGDIDYVKRELSIIKERCGLGDKDISINEKEIKVSVLEIDDNLERSADVYISEDGLLFCIFMTVPNGYGDGQAVEEHNYDIYDYEGVFKNDLGAAWRANDFFKRFSAIIVDDSYKDNFSKEELDKQKKEDLIPDYYKNLITMPTRIVLKILGTGYKTMKGQKIINLLENWQILLGMFFPMIQNIFIKIHGKGSEQVTKEGLNYIKESVRKTFENTIDTTIEQIPTLPFIKRLQSAIILLQNSEIKEALDAAHTTWNMSELRNVLKSVNLKEVIGINPIELTQMVVEEIDNIFQFTSEQMTGKNIIVDDGVSISNDLRIAAKKKNINIVTLKIVTEQEAKKRGGKLIDEQNKIRMYFDSNNNELLVYSKQGINLNKKTIKELIQIAYSEGRKNLEFSDEQVIAFSERGEISSNIEQSLANIQDRIANAAINGVQRAEVEVSLDLSGMKNIGRNIASKCNKQFATTIIINADQLYKYGSEINGLRAAGFRFILRGINFEEIREAFESDDFKLDGAILDNAERGDLSKLEELAANNTEGILHIETQMYVNMATAKEIDANRIYTDNGIIPIVRPEQAKQMTGKCAIEYEQIKDDKVIKDLLSSGKIINILCSDKEGCTLEDLRTKLAGIVKDKFQTIGELLKPKSPEQRISEETNAVSDYDFGEEFKKEIAGLKKDLMESLKDKNSIIREILITEVTEENKAEELVNKFKEAEIYQQLPSVIKRRIDSESPFESIGTIRGFVNQMIDAVVLSQWETVNREKYLEKEYKEYRQYIRIKAIQLIMAGEVLEELMKLTIDTDETVKDLFNRIRTEINKDIRLTIINNKVAIRVIETKEIPKAIEDFKYINMLLKDSLLELKAQVVIVPVAAVRNILAAA